MDQGILHNPDSRAVESLDRDHEGLDELVAVLDVALGEGDYDASLFGKALQVLVENPLPCARVHRRGVSHDAVEIEDDRVELLRRDRSLGLV